MIFTRYHKKKKLPNWNGHVPAFGSFFRKGKPLSRLRRQLPWQGSPWQRGKVQEHAGSFSEDRPLGWDPVAAGNRAGDGMACNNNDRRQWRNQGIVVGAAASKTQAQAQRMLGAATRPRVRRKSSRFALPSQIIRKTLCRAERDLQVVAARIGVHIQHLACKVKALRLFALHGLGVYLPYRNSARRDDGMG